VFHVAQHGEIFTDAAVIDDKIDIGWLAAASAVNCVRWRLQQPGAEDRALQAQLNALMVREGTERARWLRWNPSGAVQQFSTIWPEY
jgi:hypothetical protein